MTPRPTVRRLALGLVAVLALAVPAACSSDGTESASGGELRRFTVVLDWTPNTNHAGMYLAQAEGWYADAGLDVQFVEPGETSSLQALAAGRADVAVSVAEELLPARAEGLPVRSIAAVIEHNTSSLVSLASDDITEPADLEGATYGGFGGQLEEAILSALIECDGGDPDALRLVDVGEADYRIGLERDQYDVVWIFDGWDGIRLDQADVATNSIPFIDHTDCIPDWYTPILATSDDVEAERPEDLAAFVDATARGYRAAMDAPSAAADALLTGAPDLDEDLVTASADYLSTRYADDPAAWGRQEPEVWERFADFLDEAGMLSEPVDVDEAFTNEYLPSS